MFKRRRPDEPDTPAPAGSPQAASPLAASPLAATTQAAPPLPAFQPFRRAAEAAPISAQGKDSPAMARPPFTMSPSTPSNPSPVAQPMPAARPAAALAPRPVATDKRTLVVGRGISLQGAVQDAERLVVEGTVESPTLRANELEIAPGGLFRGEVEVEDAVVAGTIDGTLTARASLIVRSSGRVMGTARCRRLQVEDGGQITGRIEMITEGAPGGSGTGASAGSSANSPMSAPDPQSAPSPLSLGASSQD